MKLVATLLGKPEVVDITGGPGRYRVDIDGQVWEVDARFISAYVCTLLIDGASYVADVTPDDAGYVVGVDGETYAIEVDDHLRHAIRSRAAGATAGGRQMVKAPMPGKVSHIAVQRGDRVQAGDTLVVIEAMKMENEFKAARAGTVADVRVTVGQAVNPGDVLVVVDPNA